MSSEVGRFATPQSKEQRDLGRHADDAQKHAIACHDLDPETWERVCVLAVALLARCRKQVADREDIVQEALLALLLALHEPDGVACVFGFVRTALRFHEMKLERANRRPLSALPEDGQVLVGRDLSSGGELDLHQRLAEMPPLHREWSQLFVQHPSPAAIAHRAKVKITTVYKWAHRIRTWIRGSA